MGQRAMGKAGGEGQCQCNPQHNTLCMHLLLHILHYAKAHCTPHTKQKTVAIVIQHALGFHNLLHGACYHLQFAAPCPAP